MSFAGQQDTYLNVTGEDAVIAAVQDCWASLWTTRAISYRHEMGIAGDAVAMAVVVQLMVPSEVSGILFTANPTSGYTTDEASNLRFHTIKAPTQIQLDALLDRIIQRVIRTLERDGWLVANEQQPWLDLHDSDPLDNLNAASIRYTIALGPGKGNRTLTIRNLALVKPDHPAKTLTSNQNGFSLNAAVACQPHQRDKLERLCRYVTRPAICLDRLTLRADGQVQYQLKHPFRDGATHMLFSPLDFIGKLVALVPRPRHHLVRYHGVLAPNAKLRKHIVPATARTRSTAKRKTDHPRHKPATDTSQQDALIAPLTWAQRLKRVFDIDISVCPQCGGRLRVIAEITDPSIIDKILNHVARAPPDDQQMLLPE